MKKHDTRLLVANSGSGKRLAACSKRLTTSGLLDVTKFPKTGSNAQEALSLGQNQACWGTSAGYLPTIRFLVQILEIAGQNEMIPHSRQPVKGAAGERQQQLASE